MTISVFHLATQTGYVAFHGIKANVGDSVSEIKVTAAKDIRRCEFIVVVECVCMVVVQVMMSNQSRWIKQMICVLPCPCQSRVMSELCKQANRDHDSEQMRVLRVSHPEAVTIHRRDRSKAPPDEDRRTEPPPQHVYLTFDRVGDVYI